MDASLNLVLDDLEDAGHLGNAGDTPDSGELLDAFSQWAEGGGRPLYPHQEEALIELLDGNHVIAQTPTGSGKSMIALAAHFISLARGERSYYSAPLKALVSEKFFDLVEAFGAHNVGLITGDVALNTDAPIICCTAEILANRALREGSSLDADTVVMDEFHFYADPQRGWAWQIPLLELTKPQFVLLSATLGDTSALVEQIEAKTDRSVSLISDAERPVPLEFDYLVDPLPVVVERLLDEGRAPVYIVHFTQADAVKSAVDLARTIPLSDAKQKEIREMLRGTELNRGFGKTLRDLLLKGVGVHHAGMLPRYRRLVERLTQRGLLSIVCGTDTLGVGINVPIRTVLFTSLVKFDGRRARNLSAREFHQIAGRAGRAGYDIEGSVRVIASEAEVDAAKRQARMTAAQKAGDAAKRKKLARRAAKSRSTRQEGKVSWNRATFDRLVKADPERLIPRFQTSHSMFLNVLQGPGDPEARMIDLATEAHESALGPGSNTDPDSNRYLRELGDIYRSLRQAGLVERVAADDQSEGGPKIKVIGDLPDDFALNQPLTPFALAALDLLDPELPTFHMDVISVIESVMEDPNAVLYAQQRKARDAAYMAMREEGLDYSERQDRIEEVKWPMPLQELLLPAFDVFSVTNPWVRGRELSPKSILRELIEEGMNFTQYVAKYELTTSEGVLLRYLSDTYQALRQVLPDSYRTEEIDKIIDWLRDLLGSVDLSLLSEWEDLAAGRAPTEAIDTKTEDTGERAFGSDSEGNVLFAQNQHAMGRAIRNAVFRRVELLANDNETALGNLEQRMRPATEAASPSAPDYTDPDVWGDALDAYWEEHDGIGIDHEARSADFFSLDEHPDATDLVLAAGVNDAGELPVTAAGDYDWMIARQVILDPDDDGNWHLVLFVDRKATMELNSPALRTVRFAAV